MASAQISIGKTSLTIRYGALAAAQAKDKMMHYRIVWVTALSTPWANRYPVKASRAPEIM
ncbi:MAG TPA: hypothetical protein VEZ19_02115 [Rubrobacter sp.]|nr:hypothetical protein [Rubrobacter sp.]